MSIQLVVFDLDGTLVDSLVDLTNSVNYAMQQLSLPNKTQSQVRDAIGNGVNILLTRLMQGSDVSVDKALEHFVPHYRQHCQDNTRAYVGAVELLQQLHDMGILIGVFSNKIQYAVDSIVDNLFGNLVTYRVGTTELGKRKPDPWGLLQIMDMSGVARDNVLMVGDSVVDIHTANNGGVKCISVSYGYDELQQLQQYNDVVIGNIRDVIRYVE